MFSQAVILEANRSLAAAGFALLDAEDYDLTDAGWEDVAEVSSAWEDMPVDAYLPDAGSYRRRRYARVRVVDGTVHPQAHGPFFQGLDINPTMGGVDKWFAPIPAEVIQSPFFEQNLRGMCALFAERLAEPTAWEVDVHLFRVTCSATRDGFPIPGQAGLHREGKSFVSVQLIDRSNVSGGVSRVADDGATVVLERALTLPLDTLLVDDHRMLHDATAIALDDASVSPTGHRDVLNMDFQAVPRSSVVAPNSTAMRAQDPQIAEEHLP